MKIYLRGIRHVSRKVISISNGTLASIIDSTGRAIVVAKLDDDKVSGLDGVDDRGEATFFGE